MHGVIVERVAPATGCALFRVHYTDKTEALVEDRRVPAMLTPVSAGEARGRQAEAIVVMEDGGGGVGSDDVDGVACPVCMEDFSSTSEPDATPTILAACNHIFCAACIQDMRAREAVDGGACGTTRHGTYIECPLCKARQRVGVWYDAAGG